MPRTPGTFGSVETERSGRYRARYYGPDGRRYKAPTLFLTKKDARKWLALRHAEIIRKVWEPPGAETVTPRRKTTLADYAEIWLAHRDLKDRTREHYRKLLDSHILPAAPDGLGALPLASITADDVRRWHSRMGTDTPTMRAHAYGLLRTIMGTAASDGKIPANPCVIRGAGNARRVHKIRPATLPELAALVEAMPEQYQAMILLASWCALRFGEITELRRRDVILTTTADEHGDEVHSGVIRVERGVVRTKRGGFTVTTPKSEAGVRDVHVPPYFVPAVRDHLARFVESDRNALLFPAAQGGHLAPATLYRQFYKARDAAGRPDLRFHDLRHSGTVLAAATGATLAELMARLGHSTPAAAMRYQHAAQGRDKAIAELLSKLVES